MATMLITVSELSLWAEGDSTKIDPADPLAIWILEQASVLVMDEAAQPTWDATSAPGRAKIIVANIGKRCWNNADQELRTAIAGGPSSQVIEAAAYGMELTPAEIAALANMTPAATSGSTGLLWTLRPGTPVETTLVLNDSSGSGIEYLTPSSDPYYYPLLDG